MKQVRPGECSRIRTEGFRSVRGRGDFFFFKQKTAYEILAWLEFRRVLFRSILTAMTRGRYQQRGVPMDWVGPVGALGNGASLWHTHSAHPMRDILQELGVVDLVVADHGFAGAAIAAGIPTVAVMDTNDPALAVVARRGADLTKIGRAHV